MFIGVGVDIAVEVGVKAEEKQNRVNVSGHEKPAQGSRSSPYSRLHLRLARPRLSVLLSLLLTVALSLWISSSHCKSQCGRLWGYDHGSSFWSSSFKFFHHSNLNLKLKFGSESPNQMVAGAKDEAER